MDRVRIVSFFRLAILKILITIAVLIVAFFLLYGVKKLLGIDIFKGQTFWEFLVMLFS
ncbi:MAG: hypothetical protein JW807_04350 [Spirochaetes bacterium]|nr:hypothetical protein [Spirochaetota bacterium]